MTEYNANDIQTLDFRDAVRARIAMYMGSADNQGVLQCVREIITNSIDEMTMGFGDTITVNLLEDTVTVTDNARGVPFGLREDVTYDALVKGLSRIRQYREIILVQSSRIEPHERYDGLKRFCQEFELAAGYLKTMAEMPIKPGTIYLTPEDREIVTILSSAQHQGLTAGVDFGLVSYNDTVLKEIIAGGLTTITTDFIEMGRTVVELMRDKEIRTIHNPCHLILRKTL